MNRAYGDWNPKAVKKYPTKKEMEERFPTEMQNEMYSKILNGYLLCISTYLAMYSIPQYLEK